MQSLQSRTLRAEAGRLREDAGEEQRVRKQETCPEMGGTEKRVRSVQREAHRKRR